MTQPQKKQLKQYKDFTTITNIRKLTQQAINPVIKSIESEMNILIRDNQQLKKDIAKIDQIFKQQSDIVKSIQNGNRKLDAYKSQQLQVKIQEEKKANKLETANQKLFLEMQALKSLIKRQDQYIQTMNTRNQKMSALYSTLETRNQLSLKNMQDKYKTFTNQILTEQKTMKDQYNRIQTEILVVNENFRRQRNAMQEKYKAIQLFFTEREAVNRKFQDIYEKLISRVTRQEFQGFRKAQIKNFQDKMNSIDQQILQLIPPSLREVLPEIQLRLKRTDKIEPLITKVSQNQSNISKLTLKQTQLHNQSQTNLTQCQKTLQQTISTLHSHLTSQLTTLQTTLQSTQQNLSNQLTNIPIQLQQHFDKKLQKQINKLHETIDTQIQNRMHEISDEEDEKLWSEVEQIKKIKKKLLERSERVEEVGNCVEKKLENFGSRITKIKSDYEIFADGIRKEVSTAVKFKDQFKNNLSDIGQILSNISECLLISGSLHYQNIMCQPSKKSQISHPHHPHQEYQVFVTNNDGIIYQFHPHSTPTKLHQYRKNKLEPKQLIKSYMYSMVTFFDQIFQKYKFLDWQTHKPSHFFNERCLDNYRLRLSKHNQSKTIKLSVNVNDCYGNNVDRSLDLENDQFGTLEFNNSKNLSKGFSRTIDARIGVGSVISRNQRNQNLEEKNGQLRKSYSIKKSRATIDKSVYQQQFLSSRAACRSRISQVN